MKLFRFLKSKTFWANLILALIVLALLFWGLSTWLDSYTHHNENVKVPDLTRLSYNEAVETLEDSDLRYAILDSAEFDPTFPRGSIIGQYPNPGASVKEGRVVKLTINPLKAKKIEMPDLREKTKRRAIYDLQSKGFEIGELEYVPYIGKDVVVNVKVKGKVVQALEKFEKGTVVNLVLGEGVGKTRIKVPYLAGMTLDEAQQKLLKASLNSGAIVYDDEVLDTLAALVYRQEPNATLTPAIRMGQEVDIWLTNDYTKLPSDTLKSQYIDSTENVTPPDPAFQ